MAETAKPKDRIAEVAKAVECREDVLRLANFPEKKLTEIFETAQRSAKISKYMTTPAGLVLIGLLFTNAFGDAGTKDALNIPFVVTMLTFFGGRLLDKRPRLCREISHAALERGVERNKPNPPKLP